MLVVALAVTSLLVGPSIDGVNAVVIALVLGVVTVNVIGSRWDIDQSVPDFLLKRTLKIAVVLLGAGVDLNAVARVGTTAIAITAIAVATGMATSWWLGLRLGLEPRTAVLIGVGTAICGASAIAAVAPILRATKEELGLALATVFGFNALALLAYPVIGSALGLSQIAFGAWAGIGVHDTASAVATGFAYGPAAGEIATLVKLERTLFLIPLLVIAVVVARRQDLHDVTASGAVWNSFPWFIVGFVILAVANTLGYIGELGDIGVEVAKVLIVFVVVAVGLSIRWGRVSSLGRPLIITGLVASTAVGCLALLAIELSHIH